MQPIEIPKFPRLRGKKAIKALYDLMHELDGQRGKELTEKQTKALIKIAKELISSIEAEKRLDPSDRDVGERRFVTQPRKTIVKYVSGSVLLHEYGRMWKLLR